MEYQQIIILSNNTPIKQLHFGEKIGLKLMTMQVENIKLIGKLNLKLQYQSLCDSSDKYILASGTNIYLRSK